MLERLHRLREEIENGNFDDLTKALIIDWVNNQIDEDNMEESSENEGMAVKE